MSAAAREAVLAAAEELGYRRIAMVTGALSYEERRAGLPGISTGQDRVDGFLTALADAGFAEPTTYLRTGAHGPEQACALTEELIAMPDRPTAVFASNSRVALGVLKTIRDAGLEVPREISMVGFDDADWTSVGGAAPAGGLIAAGQLPVRRRGPERARRP